MQNIGGRVSSQFCAVLAVSVQLLGKWGGGGACPSISNSNLHVKLIDS